MADRVATACRSVTRTRVGTVADEGCTAAGREVSVGAEGKLSEAAVGVEVVPAEAGAACDGAGAAGVALSGSRRVTVLVGDCCAPAGGGTDPTAGTTGAAAAVTVLTTGVTASATGAAAPATDVTTGATVAATGATESTTVAAAVVAGATAEVTGAAVVDAVCTALETAVVALVTAVVAFVTAGVWDGLGVASTAGAAVVVTTDVTCCVKPSSAPARATDGTPATASIPTATTSRRLENDRVPQSTIEWFPSARLRNLDEPQASSISRNAQGPRG